MYRLLIIDDEIEERSDLYKDLLEEYFEFVLCSNKEEDIRKVLLEGYFDCAILDYSYRDGDNLDVIKDIMNNFKQPIIIVSDKRNFHDSDENIGNVIDTISIRFLRKMDSEIKSGSDLYSADDFETVKNDLRARIRQDIKRMVKYSDTEEGRKLSILHISDLQIDDPQANDYDLNLFFTKLTDYVNSISRKPDLIAFTGDIVFKGTKNEFNDAKTIFQPFLEAIYGATYYKHLVVVPGNHDFNYSAFLSDANESELKKESRKKKELTPVDFSKYKAPESSLFYFRQFAYDMTRNTGCWSQPYIIEKNLAAPLGLKVLGIDNANTYHVVDQNENKKRYEFVIDKLELEKHMVQKERMAVLLGHISPMDLGYGNVCAGADNQCNKFFNEQCGRDGQCRKWGTNELFMSAYNVILYLFGHQHYFSSEISKDQKRLFIGAGSPSGVNRNEMSFNLIELERKENKLELSVVNNSIKNYKMEQKKVLYYVYDVLEQKWTEKINK